MALHQYTVKIDSERMKRGWTYNRLSEESELNNQTVYNWFSKGTAPTIAAIEQVCRAFGMTLAEFFADGDLIELSPQVKELHESWALLSQADRASVQSIINSLISKYKS